MKNFIRLPESGIELKQDMEVFPDPGLFNGPDYDGKIFKVLEIDEKTQEALIQFSYRPARWFIFEHLFIHIPPTCTEKKKITFQSK